MRKAPASVGPNDKQFLQPGRYSWLGIGDGVGTNYSERGSTESSEHRCCARAFSNTVVSIG